MQKAHGARFPTPAAVAPVPLPPAEPSVHHSDALWSFDGCRLLLLFSSLFSGYRCIDTIACPHIHTYPYTYLRTSCNKQARKREKKTFGAQDFCTNNFRFMTGHISTVVQDLLVSSMLHSYVHLPRKFFNLMFNATFW